MYWVYLLKTSKYETLYIGYTSNLVRRIEQHQSGMVRSTARYLPVRLIYVEGYRNQADALLREKSLKLYGNAYRQLKRRIANSL